MSIGMILSGRLIYGRVWLVRGERP